MQDYRDALQARADEAYEQCTTGLRREFIHFKPPRKDDIRMKVLDTEQLRKQDMPVRIVPSWSACEDELFSLLRPLQRAMGVNLLRPGSGPGHSVSGLP